MNQVYCNSPVSRVSQAPLVTLQIRLEIEQVADFGLHGLVDHTVHEPGEAFGLEIQHEGDPGGFARRFKLISAHRPRGPCHHLELDPFVGRALDDLVIGSNL